MEGIEVIAMVLQKQSRKLGLCNKTKMALVGVSHSLSFFPLPPFHPSPPQNLCFQGHQFSSISAFAPTLALITNHSRSKPIASWSCRSKQNDLREVAFFDENGAVKDMDAYLNNLSLEYDSVWDTKPSWYQIFTLHLSFTSIFFGERQLMFTGSVMLHLVGNSPKP